MILAAALVLEYPFPNIPILAIGSFLLLCGYGMWAGMAWTWYVLTFGGGLFGWYFARDDVKGFFGIENAQDERGYSGD